MSTDHYVAWWNTENLFDVEDAPPDRRPDKVKRAIGDDIKGWTAEKLGKKINQLGSVIAQMNGGAGPDLLGLCEVENRFVLDLLIADLAVRLPGRTYDVAHADTDDARGIDVAFFYDTAHLEVPPGETFFHVVMRRNATREIVQVNFTTKATRQTWAVFGNHWPSRSGGQFESAGYRQIAGETLAYFHQRVLEVHGGTTPVLAMGDFNDEPFDISLVTHALSTRQADKVVNAKVPLLWNMMWPLLGDRARHADGSFYFENQPNMLDQFLVNRQMIVEGSPLHIEESSVEILRFPGTSHQGDYPRPIPFGGLGKPVDLNGFSDHFPIGAVVTERTP